MRNKTGEWLKSAVASCCLLIVTAADLRADVASIAVDRILWAGYYSGVWIKSPGNPSAQQLINDSTAYPYGLAVDPAGSKIYYTNNFNGVPGQGKIQRANLDGSGIETIQTGLDFPQSVALDGAGRVYWANNGNIQRSSLDGTNLETIFSGGATSLSIDVLHGTMYWTEYNNGRIGTALLDGINPHFIVTGASQPRFIDVDPLGGMIYWTDNGTKRIMRAYQDGTGSQLVINTTTSEIGGVAVDPYGGALYWQHFGSTAALFRSNLNGSDMQIESQLGISSSMGELHLVFTPEPSTWLIVLLLLPSVPGRRFR